MALHLLDSQFCALFMNVALCVKQFAIEVTNPNESALLLPDFSGEGFQMRCHLYMPAFSLNAQGNPTEQCALFSISFLWDGC